jgi:hypothetical protein
MCCKAQLDDKQYHLLVAKDSLSKLLLCLQDLKANIKKQKAEWDSIQDGCFNDVIFAPSEVALTRDAHFTSSKTKTSKVFIALKNLESEEFQIAKKAETHRSVCATFETMVVENEANYATTLEKSLTFTKEVKRARSKFDNLQQ